MESFVTPYRVCACIFIRSYSRHKCSIGPKQNGKICMFILDIIRRSEYTFRQLNEAIESNCEFDHVISEFRDCIDNIISDMNSLFEFIKKTRESLYIESNSVAGLFLRKVAIHFDRLTNQACSRLFDDLVAYVASPNLNIRKKGLSVAWPTPRTTRSSGMISDLNKNQKPLHQINHEISRLQANEQKALNPKDLYESVNRPNTLSKSDATFLRYLNLLRVNEAVGSKHLLMTYFDMVSDSVSRGYSALTYAIWYLHHGEYVRAIECVQECYCCAQAADDDKCLMVSLMWLSRIVILAGLKDSSKYNVRGLLELLRRRSHKAGMSYVQAMASLALEQLSGPKDDSEALKKSSSVLKQVASNNRQQNLLLANPNAPNPLDEDDPCSSGEVLAVRNSMNDVLAMHYTSLSAHLNLVGQIQSAALASQTLLHFDLIEKCGSEDVFLVNENTFIVIRNLAYHVWYSTQNFQIVRDILLDFCSTKISAHRTDYHSIWRQALTEISYEYYSENENWSEANKMIEIIRETDRDGAQLRQAELLKLMGVFDEALEQVDDLIMRLDFEENHLEDFTRACKTLDSEGDDRDGTLDVSSLLGSKSDISNVKSSTSPVRPSSSAEHKAFIKAKALLLQAALLDDETKILQSYEYAAKNKFSRIQTSCLMQLARCRAHERSSLAHSIAIDVFANGTIKEKREFRKLLALDVAG